MSDEIVLCNSCGEEKILHVGYNHREGKCLLDLAWPLLNRTPEADAARDRIWSRVNDEKAQVEQEMVTVPKALLEKAHSACEWAIKYCMSNSAHAHVNLAKEAQAYLEAERELLK